MLQSMGSQRVGHDCGAEQQQPIRADMGAFALESVRLLIIQERSNIHYQKFSSLLGPPPQWNRVSGGGGTGGSAQSALHSWKPYLPGHCQDLNLLVPRKVDQSLSLSDSRVSGGNICPIGYMV